MLNLYFVDESNILVMIFAYIYTTTKPQFTVEKVNCKDTFKNNIFNVIAILIKYKKRI